MLNAEALLPLSFSSAAGIRNAAGWDWHPASGALLFAAMERDRMGNDLPDDFLGVADKPGIDFTFPFCHWWVCWAGMGWHGLAWAGMCSWLWLSACLPCCLDQGSCKLKQQFMPSQAHRPSHTQPPVHPPLLLLQGGGGPARAAAAGPGQRHPRPSVHAPRGGTPRDGAPRR